MPVRPSEAPVKLFVSSPGDTNLERTAVHRVADELNDGIAHRLHLNLRVEGWEGWRPTQDFRRQMESHLRDCDLFIMIFHRRYGESATDRQLRSGTREEFDLAQEYSREHGKPEIFVYFYDIPAADPALADPGPQLASVLQFRQYLHDCLAYRTYPSPETFASQLKIHLVDWLFDHWENKVEQPLTRRRRDNLTRFFGLKGEAGSATIVHPAREERDRENLLPFMYAEDFHAIRGLSESLRTIGADEVTYTAQEYWQLQPKDNRAFVCVPSNPPGLAALANIRNKRLAVRTGGSKETRKYSGVKMTALC